MLQCVPYTMEMEQEWDRFAALHGAVFHTTAFRRILMEAFGYQCAYHALVDGQRRICALLPLVIGRNLGLKKVGVALPFINHLDICAIDADAQQAGLQAFLELKEKYRLGYLELRFKEQSIFTEPGCRQLRQHYTFELPLNGSEESILALSSSDNRNHVRKTYKNDWFSISSNVEHLPAFYQVYKRRMHELGSPSMGLRVFELFFRHLPAQTHLLTVLDKKTQQVIGGMMLIASPSDGTLYYPYGANLVEYNHHYLNNFMYWEAVRLGKRLGLGRLDLGRSQAGSGTYRYKAQWGATPKQLTYLLYDGAAAVSSPPDKEKLHRLIDLWKIAPQVVTDWIGPRMIRYLLP